MPGRNRASSSVTAFLNLLKIKQIRKNGTSFSRYRLFVKNGCSNYPRCNYILNK